MQRVLVAGATGFIGAHLVRALKKRGHWVRGVDRHSPKEGAYTQFCGDELVIADLRREAACLKATSDVDTVFQLAADMGGMGFIQEAGQARILRNNALVNIHMIEAARQNDVHQYIFASSACVYPLDAQSWLRTDGLREDEAYPAHPQDSYGWEKLLGEHLCRYYSDQYRLSTRAARFHNVYGEGTVWHGGREKAPAAICRKVAVAKHAESLGGVVQIWGDGEASRSYLYVADAVELLLRLWESPHREALNLGSDEAVSVNDLVKLTAAIAKTEVTIEHVEGPEGVRGRNSNNELCDKVLGPMRRTPLQEGIQKLYSWVEGEVLNALYRGADPRELQRGRRFVG